MSFSLPDVDLTTAVVGTSGKILLQNMGISAGGISANPATYKNPAMLNIRNDSGCGLGMVLRDTGGQFTLGAGEWTQQPIPPGESAIIYTVKYLLPNPPVSLLMIDYYAPGENVPQTSTLGNSPIGGSASTVTSGSTLSNEGNATNILVIDIGDTAIAKLWQVFTDHFLIEVDQSGIAHTVLQGSITGNPLKIGQAGDISEVLGSLTVDQNTVHTGATTQTGILTAPAANSLGTAGNNQSILGNETVAGTLAVTGNVTHTADTFLVNKKLSTAVSGDLLDWSGVGVTLGGNPASHGKFLYSGDGTNNDIQLSVIAPVFTGTGAGTFNHNATQFGAAVAPTDFLGNPATGGGSNANGFGSITTTQVSVGSLNAVAWRYNAVKA